MTLENYSVQGDEVFGFVFDRASSAVHSDFLATLAQVITGPYPGQHDHLGVKPYLGGPAYSVEFLDGMVVYRVIEHDKLIELFYVAFLVGDEVWQLG